MKKISKIKKNAVDEKFMTENCNKLYSVAKNEEEIFEQLDNYKPFSYDKYKE